MELTILPSNLALQKKMVEDVKNKGLFFGQNIITYNTFLNKLKAESTSDMMPITNYESLHLIYNILKEEKNNIFSNVSKIEGEILKFIEKIKFENFISGKHIDENLINGRKWRDLYLIYQSYENHLSDQGMMDGTDVLNFIFEELENASFLRKYDSLVFKNFYIIEDEEIALISRISKLKKIVIEVDIPSDMKDEFEEKFIPYDLKNFYKLNIFESQKPDITVFSGKNGDIEMKYLLHYILKEYDEKKDISIIFSDRSLLNEIRTMLDQDQISYYSGHSKGIGNDPIIKAFNLLFNGFENNFSNSYFLALTSTKVFKFRNFFKISSIIKHHNFINDLKKWKLYSDDGDLDLFIQFLAEFSDLLEKGDFLNDTEKLFQLFEDNLSEDLDLDGYSNLKENFLVIRDFYIRFNFKIDRNNFYRIFNDLAQSLTLRSRSRNILEGIMILNPYDAVTISHDTLFFPGMNANIFPNFVNRMPIFSIDELMSKFSIDTNYNIYKKEEFKFKILLSKTKKLYISYRIMGDDGNPLLKSSFIDKVHPDREIIFNGDSSDNEKIDYLCSLADKNIEFKKEYDKALEFNNYLDSLDPAIFVTPPSKNKRYLGFLEQEITTESFSISALQEYANCPYSYFLKYILGLKEMIYEDEGDNFLEGNIYHDVMFRIQDQLRKKEFNYDEFNRQFNKVIEGFIKKGEMRNIGFLPFEQYTYKKKIRNFIENEINELGNDATRQVKYFELQLGKPYRDYGEYDPNSKLDEILIKIGSDELRFEGRIDRVDKINDHYELIDYKATVGYIDKKMKHNLLFQNYIYQKLFEKANLGHIHDFEYKGIKDNKNISGSKVDIDAIDKFMVLIIKNIKNGKFPFYYTRSITKFTTVKNESEMSRKCKFCPFKGICQRRDKNLEFY